MRNFMVRAIGPFLLTAAAALGAGSVYAQAAAAFQPTKPVKIIVPFGAGGATDILARTVADKLTRSLGQPVIVDNRAGASGLIGISEVARAPADGHTLLVTNTALLQAPLLNSKAGYDPITGFTPVAQLSLSPLVFSVGSRSQAKDLREFIAMAKARPGTMTYGSAGTGQTLHLMGEVLTRSAGIQLNHVPYKGESPFINDLVGGHVDSGFSSIAVAQQHIKAGSLRALAVVGTQRSPMLPGVPTLKELGLDGFELMSWFGLFAPGGTPPAIVAALHREVSSSLQQPDVRKRLDELALSPVDASAAEFTRTVAADYESWARIIRDAGLKPQ